MFDHEEANVRLRAEVERIDNVKFEPYRAEFHAIDYYVVREGRMVGLAEAKTRDHNYGTHPDTLVDLIKWQACCHHEQALGIPCWIYFGWTCGTIARWRPATAHLPRVELVTPKARVSKSRGFTRPAVHVELSDLTVIREAVVAR